MNITPEQARGRLKVLAAFSRIKADIRDRSGEDQLLRGEADAIDWALSHIAELEAQLADMRRDLSDARSGRESAVAEVREQPAAQTSEHEAEIMRLIDERDTREEVIERILDLVLGVDRPEWSSAYGYANAVDDVSERMATIGQPAAQAVPDEWRDALQGLVDDIQGLINESYGVIGLHLNGYTARWGELLPGGRFERLTYLAVAGELLAAARPAAQAVPEMWRLRPCGEPVGYVMTEEQMGIGYDRRIGPVIWFGGCPKGGSFLYAAPTPPAAYDDGYYIQSHHGYVGNCPLWWRQGGGYTTHIDEAEVFTKEAASELLSGLSGRNDKPWPVSVVRAAATLQVDMQRLRAAQPAGEVEG